MQIYLYFTLCKSLFSYSYSFLIFLNIEVYFWIAMINQQMINNFNLCIIQLILKSSYFKYIQFDYPMYFILCFDMLISDLLSLNIYN